MAEVNEELLKSLQAEGQPPQTAFSLSDIIERNEGRRSFMYLDPEGIETVGVGFNLRRSDARQRLTALGANYDDVLAGNAELNDTQIDTLRDASLAEAEATARAVVTSYDKLSVEQQVALSDMAFNMGPSRLGGFKKMLAAIELGDFAEARKEMLDSDYARELPNRSGRNADAIVQVNAGKMAAQFAQASTTSADDAFRQRFLSKDTGIPLPTVQRKPDEAEQEHFRQRFLKTTAGNPVTREFLQDPDALAVAHDDIENMGVFETLARGMGERVPHLLGGYIRTVGTTAAEALNDLEGMMPLGMIEFDLSGDGPLVQWRPLQENEAFQTSNTLPLATNLEAVKLNYQQMTTWEDFKDSPLTNFIPFALEQGLISLPDMAAALTLMPAYIVARTGEIGQDRAQNDGRVQATVEDLMLAAPFATASALLDRIGGKSILGIGKEVVAKQGALTIAKNVGAQTAKGAFVEGTTEGAQEGLEFTGERVGTAAGFNLAEALERVAQGVVGGTGFGATVRAGTSTVQEYQAASRRRGKVDQLNETAKASKIRQRDAELDASFQAEAMRKNGIPEVSVAPEALRKYAIEHADGPDAAISQLGITPEQMTDALENNADITLPVEVFTRHILGTPGYDLVANDLKTETGQTTVAEAVEPIIEQAPQLAAELITIEGVTPKLRQRVAELLEEITESDAVGAHEALSKAPSNEQQVLSQLIDNAASTSEDIAETVVEGRRNELDRVLSDLDQEIVTKENEITAAEEAGDPTTRLNQQLQLALAKRDTASAEQANLDLPDREAITTPPSEAIRQSASPAAVAENQRLEDELVKLRDKKTGEDQALARARLGGDQTVFNRVRRRITAINKEIAAAEAALAKSTKALADKPKKKTLSLKAQALDALDVKVSRDTIRNIRKAFRAGLKLAATDIKAAQKAVVSIVKASGLSTTEQGKFLTAITNVTKASQLDRIQSRVLNALERQRKRELKAALKKTLAKVKVQRVDGRPRGKLTPVIQQVVDSLTEKLKFTKDEAGRELGRRIGGMEDVPGPQERLENMVLAAVADPDQVNSVDLENLLFEVNNLIAEGKAVRAAGDFARIEKAGELRIDVLEALGPERNAPGPLREAAHSLEASILTWNGTFQNKLRRIFASRDAELVNRVAKELSLFEEARAHEKGKIESTQRFIELVQKRFGNLSENSILQKMLKSMTDRDLGLGEFVHSDGKTKKLDITTRAELRQRAMELRNTELNALIRDPKSNAYTQEIIDAINAALTKEDLWLIDAQLEFYSEYYERINAAYEQAYGVSLPKIENYVPISREFTQDTSDEFLQGAQYLGGIVPGSLKSRVPARRPLLKAADVTRMQTHMAEMEYFIAYHEKVRLLNDVFAGDDAVVSGRIRANYGNEFIASIKQDLQYFANRGIAATSVGEKLMVALMRNFSFAQLGLKPQIGLKQLASFAAYAEDVKTVNFMEGMAKFLSNPRKAIRFLDANSDFFKNRPASNVDQDFRDITTNSKTFLGKRPRLTRVLMYAIRFGDRSAIAAGFAHVHAAMKEGKTQEQALRSFEDISVKTQQSPDPDQLSSLQRSNSWGRLLAQFMSSANALARAEYTAIIEASRGRISKGELAKRIIIYHLVIPNLIQWITNAFHWDEEDQWRASILGSFNGLFVIGDVMEFAVSAALGSENLFDLQIRHPVGALVQDIIKAIDAFDTDDFGIDEIIDGNKAIDRALRATGAATGVPLATAANELRGLAKFAQGDTAEGVTLMLGWSPYIVDKNDIGD